MKAMKFNHKISSGAIALVFTCHAQAQLTWDTSNAAGVQITAGTWDAATSNWTNDGGTTNTTWINETAAVFNGDLAAQTDITLSGAISAIGISRVGTGAGILRLVASTGNTLAVSGEVNVETRLQWIGGDAGAFTGSYTKTGTGSLILDGNDTRFGFGTVTLSSGSIALFNGSGLQSETLILNGGAIGSWNNFARSFDGNVMIGGDIGMGSGTGPELNTGTLNFGSAGTVNLGGETRILTIGSVVVLNGVVSNGGITKEGGARLDFSNIANTFSGPITVNSGELRALTGIDQTGELSTLGTGAVTVNSGAQLTMSTAAATTNAKSYGNAISLDGATLRANGGVTTLSGPITLSGANTIQTVSGTTLIIQENIAGTGSFTKAEAGRLQIGNGGTTGTLGSGSVTISGGSLQISRSNDYTVANDISGGGVFRTQGTGTITLTGNNSWTGNTRVLGGGVLSVTTVDDAGGTGVIGAPGGTLRVAEDSTLRITGSGTQTSSRAIWNSGGDGEDGPATFDVVDANTSVVFTSNGGNINRPLTKSGAGSLTLNQQIYSVAGNTVTVNGGTLQLNNNNFWNGATNVNAGTLIIGNGGSTGTIGSGNGAVTIGTTGVLRINRGDTYTIANAISGEGGFIQQGTGTTTLTGNNTYGGSTSLQGGGTLVVTTIADAGGAGSLGTLSTPGASWLGVRENSTLRITGAGTQTTSRIVWNDAGTGSGTFDVVDAGASVVFTTTGGTINRELIKTGAGAMTLTRQITTTGAVTVNGGSLTLLGANTYSGATNVNAGTLAINNSLGSGSTVSVANGATLINNGTISGAVTTLGSTSVLTGTGTFGGAVTIGGQLNPGNSPGYQAFNTSLTLGSDALTTFELGGITRSDLSANGINHYDAIDVTGLLTLDGFISLTWFGGYEATNGTTFNLLNWGSIDSSGFNLGTDLALPTFADTTLSWDTSSFLVDGSIAVIPEPAAALLGGLGLLFLLRRRRAGVC
jgi:fibronectin-binding autotransporter adhesin